jgi:hypothetical protein
MTDRSSLLSAGIGFSIPLGMTVVRCSGGLSVLGIALIEGMNVCRSGLMAGGPTLALWVTKGFWLSRTCSPLPVRNVSRVVATTPSRTLTFRYVLFMTTVLMLIVVILTLLGP